MRRSRLSAKLKHLLTSNKLIELEIVDIIYQFLFFRIITVFHAIPHRDTPDSINCI